MEMLRAADGLEITEWAIRTMAQIQELPKLGKQAPMPEITHRKGGEAVSSMPREVVVKTVTPWRTGKAHITGKIKVPNESGRLAWLAFEALYCPETRIAPIAPLK